jgi:hypothetical protein
MAKKAMEITDLDTWLFAYKRKRPGVGIGMDGSLQVGNPKNPDEAPKRIPHLYGVDAARVLNNDAHAELRAAATAKATELEVAQSHINDQLYSEFSHAESDYLITVDNWNAEHSAENARAVATAQRRVAAADKAYREAKYKHREVQSIEGLARMVLDYRTKDERRMVNELQLASLVADNATDRTIEVDKA